MNGFDVGGEQFSHEMWLEDMENIKDIKEDRKRRVRDLAGGYVVATKGKSSGNIVFFQDPKISTKGYWTQFLSNAKGFDSLEQAKNFARGFKYNNPRVAFVEKSGNYKWI